MRSRALLVVIALLALAAFGCAGIEITPTPAVTRGPVAGEAVVESIEILILESFPVQVNVVARGNLPDGCTAIDRVMQERDGNAFLVTITTIRPAGAVCTEALVPFEEVISLGVYGLPAGVYTVTVNGVGDTFELTMDNVLPEEVEVGTIGGRVWHDLCAVPYESVDEPPEGCVMLPGGGLEANGVLEPGEPGILGVLVALGMGDCPSTGLATAITDEDGFYVFTGLGAGTYCVSIDPLDDTNESILIPGGWTYPALEVSDATVYLLEGTEVLDVDFGWDYQFLP